MTCLPTVLWLGSLVALIINWHDVTGWIRYLYIGLLILGPWTAATVRTAFRSAVQSSGANLEDPLSRQLAYSEAHKSTVVNFWVKCNMALTLILVGFGVYAFLA